MWLSERFQKCFDKSVLFRYFSLWNDRFGLTYLTLNEVSAKPMYFLASLFYVENCLKKDSCHIFGIRLIIEYKNENCSKFYLSAPCDVCVHQTMGVE